MIFSSLFLPLTRSIWWDFQEAEFFGYEENSLKHPIFAVCTSTHCPHCKGLPEMLQAYSNMLGNNTPVVFTNINCQKSVVCNKIGVRGVPAFVLIRSTKPKYWVQTYERNMMGWNRFLQSQIRTEIIEVMNDEHLRQLIRRSYNGGTTFYLQVGEEKDSDAILNAFRKQAMYYNVMGNTFAYKKEGKETKITGYSSEYCSKSETVTAKTLATFIEKNYNSKFYHFDSNELYDSISENKTTMIFVSQNPMETSQRNAIDSISRNHCDDITFGWADKNVDIPIVKFAGKTVEDDNFFFIVNPVKKCFSSSSSNPSETDFEDFIAKSVEHPQCKRIPGLRRSGKKKHFTKSTLYFIAGVIGVLFCGYFIYQIFDDGPLKLE